MRILLFAPAVAALLGPTLAAQDTTELLNRMKAMEDRIKALEAEVQSLKGQPAAVPAQPAAAPVPPASPAVPMPQQQPPAPIAGQAPGGPALGGAGGAAAKVLNPDISVIGDFLGAAGNAANRPTPSLEMHESEVGFQEIIDPYARGDFFISFGEKGVDLEEGYITFTALPKGLQLKAGKMRAAFGKVNTLHNHTLPWTDRPLVSQNLRGGEEGLSDAGISLSRILPAPKGIFLEGTGQLYRGDSENVFQSRKRSDLATIGHLRGYHDINEATNLDLGGSFARGRSPFGNGWNQLYGIDATLRWKPLQRSIYNSFVARSELVWARTALASSAPLLGTELGHTKTYFGFYASGEYQLTRHWFAGGRFDRSERGACLPTLPETTDSCAAYRIGQTLQDTGGALTMTYWPTEFMQIRSELRRNQYGEGRTANEFMMQLVFSMGAHGAHPF